MKTINQRPSTSSCTTLRSIRLAAVLSPLTLLALIRLTALGDDKPPESKPPQAAAATSAPSAVGRMEGGQAGGRWREGSRLIDQVGSFKLAGERVTFVSADGKLKFDCLENLCAERISRTITDSPDSLQWSVCGTVTECHGTNYVLLTQAVLKAPGSRQRRLP